MPDPLERFRPTSETLARSVLDRLLDADPDLAADPRRTIGAQVEGLREALRRDIEILLNTRCRPDTPPDGLADSLLGYGVDGFFATSLVTDEQSRRFARGIEARIRRFEPRLEAVSVSVLPARVPAQRSLRLRIEAMHRLQPGMPPISFETAVDPSTQRIRVEAAHG
ncbi:type VI secretion system baseplate subunit TssE [Aureimonas leprariae]|uniref:Type VI secretion system baseplate subunit TssE n=1 Tax=Plantimonas leprariae TaxID=2615207 RepID=A0A7V7PQ79_9HYPH|nr:type VI secretion system baseplate subunit TssE [Aureimonas leprariae]KAB0680239.1 type VI secretion system baseplate subunit TssE [Aureimonas leprariae]